MSWFTGSGFEIPILYLPAIIVISTPMTRSWILFLLLGLGVFTAGCSNRPLAGTLDLLSPSKVRYKSDPDSKPAGIEPFEPVLERDRVAPRDRSSLPRLNEPFRPSETDVPFRRDGSPRGRRGGESVLPEPLPVPNFGQ